MGIGAPQLKVRRSLGEENQNEHQYRERLVPSGGFASIGRSGIRVFDGTRRELRQESNTSEVRRSATATPPRVGKSC